MHHKHNYNCYYPTEVLKDFEFQLVHVQIIFSSLKWAHHYFHPHLQAFFLLLHWEHYLELVQNLKDFIFLILFHLLLILQPSEQSAKVNMSL